MKIAIYFSEKLILFLFRLYNKEQKWDQFKTSFWMTFITPAEWVIFCCSVNEEGRQGDNQGCKAHIGQRHIRIGGNAGSQHRKVRCYSTKHREGDFDE